MAETFQLKFDQIDTDLDYFLLTPEGGETAPLVICLHGLGSHKESLFNTAISFCRKGFRTVGMDLARHGRRPGSETREAMLDIDYIGTMFGMIQQSVKDVTRIVDFFGAPRAAVHGISLGGIVIFAGIIGEPRIEVASVAMGSPDWIGLAEALGMDPHHPAVDHIARCSPLEQAERMHPCALLVLHGMDDEIVPFSGVEKLAAKLEPLYAQTPRRFEFVAYRDIGHSYVDDMLERSVDWTVKHMQ